MLTASPVSPRWGDSRTPAPLLLCSVLTISAARTAMWCQIRKVCKIPILLSKPGITGDRRHFPGHRWEKSHRFKVILSIWRFLTKMSLSLLLCGARWETSGKPGLSGHYQDCLFYVKSEVPQRQCQSWLTDNRINQKGSWALTEEWKKLTLPHLQLQRHGAESSRRQDRHMAAFLHMLFTLLCITVSKTENPGWNPAACSSVCLYPCRGCETSWAFCFTSPISTFQQWKSEFEGQSETEA